jgi:hypothetical protein
MPTPRTIVLIVALPKGTPATWPRVAELTSRHGWAATAPAPLFPLRRKALTGWATRWSSRHLVEVTRHHDAAVRAAGGRIARLNLNQLAWHARCEAAARWRTWNAHAARGTSVAQTWDTYLAEHHRDPRKLPLAEACARFEAQPRVLAMLAYNSYPLAHEALPVKDLAAFQAGEAVYVSLHLHRALSRDALITPDGRVLQPASPALADALHYYTEAARIIAHLNPTQHLVAVRATPTP